MIAPANRVLGLLFLGPRASLPTLAVCAPSSSGPREPRSASPTRSSARSASVSSCSSASARDDTIEQVARLAARVARLRVFPDAAGRFDRSLLDVGGSALVVSQFTLYGDTARGHRPSMSGAAGPELAEPIYERFCEALSEEGVGRVERGVFGASMQVELVNDGPVTLLLEG